MKQYQALKPVFFFIILIAFILRVLPTDWDGGYYTHPDEAHIYNVVFQLEMPRSINSFFSKNSPLNPHFFAYGSLPLYLLKGVAGIFGIFDSAYAHYGNLYKIGRPLSAFFDVGTLILLVVLSKKLFNSKRLALIAGGLYAITVFAIQNAHFYIVDTQLTFWATATLTALVYAFSNKKSTYVFVAAATAGCAMATKFSGVTLVPLVLLGAVLLPLHTKSATDSLKKTLLSAAGYVFTTALLMAVLAVLLQPYVLIDFETFRENLALQLTMSRDATIFPYTIQYLNTAPYLYPLAQIVNWGIGPTVGITALIGILALTIRTVRSLVNKQITPLLFVTLFVWGTYLSVGGSAVKFMRYLLPLYPILILCAALVIVQLAKMQRKAIGLFLIGIIVIPSVWWAGAFLSIYQTQHPWIAASNWMHDTIPVDTPIAVEHWDRSLPLYSAHRFPAQDLELYVPDSRDKVTRLVDTLYDSTYIVIASNRVYDAVPKFPSRYPATMKYYDLLFNGQLGFTKVAEFSSYPTLLGITKNDQSADESFTVYDHPKVQIFKKTVFNREAVAQMLYNSL